MSNIEKSRDLKRVVVFGAGGHGREIAWLARQCFTDVLIEFAVNDPQYLCEPIRGMPVRLLHEFSGGDSRNATGYVVAVGNPRLREELESNIADTGLNAVTLVHPRIEVSDTVDIDEGSVLCAGVIVTCDITIGRHVHVNVGCSISHDSRVGDFSTLSPGVQIAGCVHVGSGVFIGTGASVINGTAASPLIIGDGAVIAAGACVTKPVDPGTTVAGVPAKRLDKVSE